MGRTSGLSGHSAASPRPRLAGERQGFIRVGCPVRACEERLSLYMNSHVCCWSASLLRTRPVGYTGCVCSTRLKARWRQRPAVPVTSQRMSHVSRGCAKEAETITTAVQNIVDLCFARLGRVSQIWLGQRLSLFPAMGSLQRAAPPPLVPRLQQRLPSREVAETTARPQEL